MSYEAMVDQLKAVPQECLAETETYISEGNERQMDLILSFLNKNLL